MYSYTKSKPRPAFTFDPPDSTKIYKHAGENERAFDYAAKNINFLAEMFKFFPNFLQEGYSTGTEETFTASGIGSYNTDEMKEMAPDEESEWYSRGYKVRGLLASTDRGDYSQRYGDLHNVSIFNTFWGYGGGKSATNVNFSPTASEFNHFEDLHPESYDSALDYYDYEKTVFGGSDIYNEVDRRWAGSLGAISSDWWNSAKNTLNKNGLNGKSYFEIALTGVSNSKIHGWKTTEDDNQDLDGNGTIDEDELGVETIGFSATGQDYGDGGVVHNGGFLYDSLSSTDAFGLMLSMLESRRRIFYAMSSLFGSPYLITNTSGMINYIQDQFSNPNKLGGVSPYNKRVLETFFAAQHALRSVLPEYSKGVYADDDVIVGSTLADNSDPDKFSTKDDGYFGYAYAARDQVGFQRFRGWLADKVASYIRGVSSTTDDDDIDDIVSESDLDGILPYDLNPADGGIFYYMKDQIFQALVDQGYLTSSGKVTSKFNGDLNSFRNNFQFKYWNGDKWVYFYSGDDADAQEKEVFNVLQQVNAQKLWEEYTFNFNQPYGADELGKNENTAFKPLYIGWDRYTHLWDKEEDEAPYGINPFWEDVGDNHPNYAIAQILGLTKAQILGLVKVNDVNLYRENWVTFTYGNFVQWTNQVEKDKVLSGFLTSFDRMRYKRDMRAYRRYKSKKKDKEYEYKVDQAKIEAAIEKRKAEQKAALNKAIQKRKALMQSTLRSSKGSKTSKKARAQLAKKAALAKQAIKQLQIKQKPPQQTPQSTSSSGSSSGQSSTKNTKPSTSSNSKSGFSQAFSKALVNMFKKMQQSRQKLKNTLNGS